jgi:hypothetical protein
MFVGCGQLYTDLKKLNVKSIVNTLLEWAPTGTALLNKSKSPYDFVVTLDHVGCW